jgi:serine/threonine-protein kinase HipA
MKKITVYYSGWGEHWELGQLADDGRQLLFEYSAQALKQGLELSPLHLKLRAQSYSDFPQFQLRLPGLIADCLPDGWGMLLMDKLFRQQGLAPYEISPLDRLALLGKSGIGALSFEPEKKYANEYEILKIKEIANEIKKIISDQASPALLQLVQLGGSPHGARPKVLVNYDVKTNQISSDPNGPGVPWLIKFQAQNEHKEVCLIEQLYAAMAKKSGVLVAENSFFDLDKSLSAFGTKRFDRIDEKRVPIQSLAGMLNADFRIPGSVNYSTLLRVTRFVTKNEQEVYRAYRQCVFNVIFNNRDDHAKNFSFLLNENRRWILSLAYDLTFSDGPNGEHQMDIMSEGKNPGRTHLMALAEDAGLEKDKCQKIIDDILQVAKKFKMSTKKYAIREKTINEITAVIAQNIRRF